MLDKYKNINAYKYTKIFIFIYKLKKKMHPFLSEHSKKNETFTASRQPFVWCKNIIIRRVGLDILIKFLNFILYWYFIISMKRDHINYFIKF